MANLSIVGRTSDQTSGAGGSTSQPPRVSKPGIQYAPARPNRKRFLLFARHYHRIFSSLVIAIVAASVGFTTTLWAMLWVGFYLLYRSAFHKLRHHARLSRYVDSSIGHFVRAQALALGVFVFVTYIQLTTSSAATTELLWLLYVLVIFSVSRNGSTFLVIGTLAFCTVLLSLTQAIGFLAYGTPLPSGFGLDLLVKIFWLVLVAFVFHMLVRDVQERAANLDLVQHANSIAVGIDETIDESTLLQRFADAIAEQFTYKGVTIFLRNHRGDLQLRAGATPGGKELARQEFTLREEDGIVGLAAQSGWMQLVQDVKQEKRFIPHDLFPDTRAELAVPILINRQVVGVLDIQAPVYDGFSHYDQELLALVAKHIGQGLDRVRMLRAQTHIRELVELIAHRFVSDRDLDEMLDNIVGTAADALRADLIVLYEFDQTTKEWVVGACHGEIYQSKHFRSGMERMVRYVHRLLLERESFHFHPNVRNMNDPLFEDQVVREDCEPFVVREKIVSRAIIRLESNGEPLGFLFLNYRSSQQFDAHQRELHRTFAGLAEIALQKAITYEQQQTIVQREMGWLIHPQTTRDFAIVDQICSQLLADRRAHPYQSQIQLLSACSTAVAKDYSFVQRMMAEDRSAPLVRTLSGLAEGIRQIYGVDCRVSWHGETDALLPAIQYQLRLIINDALLQAIKHGKATSIEIRGEVTAGRVQLSIKDDGRTSCLSALCPILLEQIKWRVAHVGGDCWMSSRPVGGTTIRVQLPILNE